MLAVVKTPRTDIKIKGYIPAGLLAVLKKEYGQKLRLKDDDEEYVDYFDTDEYRNVKGSMTPGTYLMHYREMRGFTQAELGKKFGHSRAYVCDLEKGRRAISKGMAKKLAKLFGTSVERFI